eukprot:12160100-Alexandrium_andersonii.AAC.1
MLRCQFAQRTERPSARNGICERRSSPNLSARRQRLRDSCGASRAQVCAMDGATTFAYPEPRKGHD